MHEENVKEVNILQDEYLVHLGLTDVEVHSPGSPST